MGAKKYGGFEKYILEESRQLTQKGHKLIVVFDREPLAKDYISDLIQSGAEYVIIEQKSKFEFAKAFWNLLRKFRPEIVHTNFSSNLFYALPLAWLAGAKKRIATEHCLPEGKTLRQKLVNQAQVLVAQTVLPVSNMSTKAIKKSVLFGRSKVRTLYLGVENKVYDKKTARIELNIYPDTIALMNIAYHNPVKGVDVLLEAMNIIVNKRGIKDIVLYQIGGGQTGKDTEYLHELAKQYNIESNIVWLGIRNDVPRLLAAGDIYVQPSRSEGIPLSIMEASIASLPVVATDAGGNPEAAVQGVNALLVGKENPDALAEAIISLYFDSEMRKRFGASGRKLALEKFCLSNQVSSLIRDHYNI